MDKIVKHIYLSAFVPGYWPTSYTEEMMMRVFLAEYATNDLVGFFQAFGDERAKRY